MHRSILPLAAGGIFASAWWIFIDLVLVRDEPLDSNHYVPGFVATFGAFLILIVPAREFRDDSMFSSTSPACARACIFIAFIVSLGAVVASFLITADVQHLSVSEDLWLMGALGAQTTLIFVAALVCLCHRMSSNDDII